MPLNKVCTTHEGAEPFADKLGEAFIDNKGLLEDVLNALFFIARADAFATICRGMRTPMLASLSLVNTLLRAIADGNARLPVYGTCAASRRRCTAPSSP